MKTASPALAALINSGDFDFWDCYSFTLFGGGVLYYTTAHFPINIGGILLPANGPRVSIASNSNAHWKVGFDVDQWQVSFSPRVIDDLTQAPYPDKLGSQPFLAALQGGAFDAAQVLWQRVFFPSGQPTYPIPRSGAVPLGSLIISRGIVASCNITDSVAVVTINDIRQLLSVQMPRNVYQASCEHILFDAGCGLIADNYKKIASVTSVPPAAPRAVFSASPGAPAGSGDYTLGRVRMDSGDNAGFWRQIRFWDGGTGFLVLNPFPYAIKVGDQCSFWPGCDKTMAACSAFGNLINFGGEPYIPPPDTVGIG